MSTAQFIEELRAEIKEELKDEIMRELEPTISHRLYGNIFNVEEAAKYRRVSKTTIRRMVASNEIPHFVQRGQIFFRQIDLDKQVEQQIKRKE